LSDNTGRENPGAARLIEDGGNRVEKKGKLKRYYAGYDVSGGRREFTSRSGSGQRKKATSEYGPTST